MLFIFAIVFVLLSLFKVDCIEADYRESFKGREWEFLQYEIRTKFDHNLNYFAGVFFKHSFGMIGLSIGLFKYLTKDIDKHSSEENLHKFDTCMFGTVFSCYAAILFFMAHVKHWAALRTYENFIRNWPQNKPFVPQHYKELLDAWHTAYLEYGPESAEYHTKRCQAMSIIEQALDNKFPAPTQIYNYTYVPIYR